MYPDKTAHPKHISDAMNAKNIAKTAISRIPWLLPTLQKQRLRRYRVKRYAAFQGRFAQSVYADGPIEVLSGPFANMRYFDNVVWGPITPKWIGSYESELHEALATVMNTSYDVVVDVGAAEGYYAVGLARAKADTRVITYDIDGRARKQQRQLAELNGVADQVDVRGYCRPSDLQRDIADARALVISDIEGSELELLDPEQTPSLCQADILIECHDREDLTAEQVLDLLATRFEPTHSVEVFRSSRRSTASWADLPNLRPVPSEDLSFALDESRNHPQPWLWLRTKKPL